MIKELHHLLKNGTSDSRKSWFNVGSISTTPPEHIHTEIKALLKAYNAIKSKTLDNINDFQRTIGEARWGFYRK